MLTPMLTRQLSQGLSLRVGAVILLVAKTEVGALAEDFATHQTHVGLCTWGRRVILSYIMSDIQIFKLSALALA